MRFDADGMFWQDIPQKTARGRSMRPMPTIPETGWTPPREFPNLSAAAAISIDTETFDPELNDYGPGWARHKGHIAGVSIAVDGGSWYFPMRHEVEPHYNLNPEHVLAWLRDTLGNPRQPKVGANLYYDLGWLREEGVNVVGDLVDVQFAEALLDEQATVALEDLGTRYLGVGKETDLLKKWILDYYAPGKSVWRKDIYRAPPRLVGPYAEQDAVLPLRIAREQYPRLLREGLFSLFRMECELLPLWLEMRFRGVRVDIDRAMQVKESLDSGAAELQKQLHSLVGFDVNINAAESIARGFDTLGIAYPRTAASATKPNGSPSFTKTFLEQLDHPVGDVIRGIRAKQKLANTFIQSYILDANVNGIVYTEFHPLRGDSNGTRSGRLSSSNPNLQNIPTRTKEGKLIRSIFVPHYGRWRRYDYNQVEYRGLAHFAIGPKSDDIRAKYNADPRTDYHVATQQMIFALTGKELERSPVKNINFGLTYAMGKKKLIRSLGLDQRTGNELFKAYHAAVPFTKKTLEQCAAEAQELGYITTLLGRKSRFDLWEPSDWTYDEDGEGRQPALTYHDAIRRYGKIQRAHTHKALNRRLQGTAADIIKAAMHRCWYDGVYADIGVPMLTVHDETDHSDDQEHERGFAEMKRIFENTIQLRIPLLVDPEAGPNWGELAAL